MWIIFSFASLFFLNVRNILTKFNVSNTHAYVSMWYTFIFQFPLGLIAVLATGIQISDPKFFLLVLLRVILDIIAFVFFFKALQVSKLSLILPFMALLPALTIFTSFAINGQEIHLLRLLLVFVIAFCCYSIYKHGKERAHSSDDKKGILYIFLVIGLYSILDPLHAEILKISSPFTYFFISSIYFIVIWTGFILFTHKKELFESFTNKKNILFNGANGVVLSLEVISLFLALVPGSITSVVTAIRSTNTATSSVIGGVLFKEHLNTKKIFLIGIITLSVILLIVSH
jgi:uncharacterized membrane protein